MGTYNELKLQFLIENKLGEITTVSTNEYNNLTEEEKLEYTKINIDNCIYTHKKSSLCNISDEELNNLINIVNANHNTEIKAKTNSIQNMMIFFVILAILVVGFNIYVYSEFSVFMEKFSGLFK